MSARFRRSNAVLTIVGLVLAAAPASAASLQDLQGAWTTDHAACARTFSFGGGGPGFRPDADLFASAFIVQTRRIRTPLASCRVASQKRDGDWLELRLACENTVSDTPMVARFSLVERGLLVRRMGPASAGTAPRGTAFIRCEGTAQ